MALKRTLGPRGSSGGGHATGFAATSAAIVKANDGIVTATSSLGEGGLCSAHDLALLSWPPLSGADHPARNLAVSALHIELPRRRGASGRTGSRPFLRNDPALGAEVRPGARTETAATPAAAGRSLAFGG